MPSIISISSARYCETVKAISSYQSNLAVIDEEVVQPTVAVDEPNSSSDFAVRRFPLEIWMEIFSFCLPDEIYITPNPAHAPLLLTQVCSQWREACFSSPQLWTSASFVVQTGKPAYTAMVEAWLARCGSRPLSMEITSRLAEGQTPSDLDRAQDTILPAITASTQRWRSAQLSLRTPMLRQVLANPMPLLASLHLNATDMLPRKTIDVASVAPNLRRLSSVGTYQDPFNARLPWGQLAHFHCRYPLMFDAALDMLRQSTNLTSCDIRICISPAAPFSSRLAPATAEDMESMILTVGQDETVVPFLNKITLPRLRAIELRQTSAAAPAPVSSLAGLFARSRCPVERLCIKNMVVDETELVELVRNVPSLVDIEVSCGDKIVVMDRVTAALRAARTATASNAMDLSF